MSARADLLSPDNGDSGTFVFILIVAIYLAGLLALGVWCSRTRIASATDFLLAGRRLGVWMCGGALAATHFGGGALLGGAEYGFRFGAAGVWYGVATGVGLLGLGFFTAGRFRRLSLVTVPDYLAARYGGQALRLCGALLSLVALVGILAAQVNAAGRAFQILGFNGIAAPIVAVLVFVAYTTLGGLWAATVSDLFQLVIAATGVLIAAIVTVSRCAASGGLRALLDANGVASTYLTPFGEGGTFVLWLLLPTVMYTLIGQDFYQRLFAARSPGVARASAIGGGLFLIGISVLPVIVGMGAFALTQGAVRPDEALPWVLRELMHPLTGGIILAAILAAIMSTADSLLTSATSHVVHDIWIASIGGEGGDERRVLRVSRWVTVGVGLLALGIGMSLPGIVDALIYSYTMYTAGILVPVLGGVVWKGATRAGALAAVAVGSVIALIGLTTRVQLGGVPTEIYAAAISAVAFWAGSTIDGRRRGRRSALNGR